MAKDKCIYLILDNIRSLLNVGAIFRTADAAGVSKIYLCGITAYPPNKLIRWIDRVDIIQDTSKEITYTPSKKCIWEFLKKEIAKTALAGLNSTEWEYQISTIDVIKKLKNKKINVIALEQSAKSVDYRSVEYKKPLAVIVGSEISGVSREVLNLCDQIAEIPMAGKGKSLNVATATGIVLFKAIE